MKQIFFLLAVLAFSNSELYGQQLHIGVLDQTTNEPLIGAMVIVKGTDIGGPTDYTGHIMLNDLTFPLSLELSYVGYESRTIELVEPTSGMKMFLLTASSDLDAVVVEAREMSTDIDPLAASQLERISSKELLKAACCNLSESFENSATVDVSYSDAVSGSRQISMLGLAGVYSQINWENMPLVRGLGEYYGLGFVPGTWIESIQVGKGAGSVVNGYESMTGQINVEFHKPDNMDSFYLNAYQNIQGRTELNSHFGKTLNSNWSSGVFLHGNLLSGEPDNNLDNFLDRNRGGQLNIFNRWKYVGNGNMRSQFGVKYLHDEKVGGQVGFRPSENSQLYGVEVVSDRVEVFAKNGWIFPEKPWKSVGLIMNGTVHDQDSQFGDNALISKQESLYANLILQSIIGDTRHTIKTGANFQLDNFNEHLSSSNHSGRNNYLRKYTVPGVFAEYDYDNFSKLKAVIGLRADYLNTTKNIELSPRIHLKWNTDGENAFRLSAGRGFRVPNLYADAPSMLVNSREVIINEQPDIESSWNMGASLTRYFRLNGKDGTFVADFYRTTFENQLIRDLYTSANHIFISNLDGKSFANSFQASIDYEVFDQFELRLAYKRDNVQQDIAGQRIERQLTPKHRGLINFAYATNYDRWVFDATAQYVGEQRLPTTAVTPNGLTTAHFSDDFVRVNGQITTRYRDWDIYLGGENLGNFKQQHPIVSPENPFGNEFDASNVWGPIMGRNAYLGVRYRIKTDKE